MKYLILLDVIIFSVLISTAAILFANTQTTIIDTGIQDNSQELFLHIQEGDIQKFNALLNHGADPNCRNDKERTPLIFAVEHSQENIIKLLLSKNIDIDAKDFHDRTALLYAVHNGNRNIVNMLIEHGADTNKANAAGSTPLMKACSKGFYEIAKDLLAAGANVDLLNQHNLSALKYAVSHKNNDIVKLLLNKGADINIRDVITGSGETPLMIAARDGNCDILNMLLEHGADVNLKNFENQTALFYAVNAPVNAPFDRKCIVKKLIEADADVNFEDNYAKTALIYAAEKGDAELVKILLDAGAKNRKDDGTTKTADERQFSNNKEYQISNHQHGNGVLFTIKASSSLKSYKGTNYYVSKVHDYKTFTAWVEGAEGDGIGEYLEYKFDFSKVNTTDSFVNKILVYNGYQKNPKLWKANSRIKQMKLYLNNKPHSIIDFKDISGMQIVELPKIDFKPGKITIIKCEILSVFKGTKYKDTAISDMIFVGI